MGKRRLALAGAICAQSFYSAQAAEIDSETSTPVSTSTIESGGPGDITITDDGSIEIESTDGVFALTLDSDNAVDIEGEITLTTSDNSVGLLIEGGHTGSVNINGSITQDDDYEREDTDDDDDDDGPYAEGEGRYGVLLDSAGAFVGDIDVAGAIVVQGNDSYGINLNSLLDGDFTLDGSIAVTGDNAVGIEINDGVTGDMRLSGAVSALGVDALGVSIRGDVGGGLTNEGSIISTGFASTSLTNYVAPADVDDDTLPLDERIDAEDLNDNRPALAIGGDIADGFLNNGGIGETDDDDETKDTIEDYDENRSTGSIYSYGSAPAVYISPDWDTSGGGDIVFGHVVEHVRDTSDDDEDDDVDEIIADFTYDYGFINRGSIIAIGRNVGYDATGVRIEGSSDGLYTTTIEGGLLNYGSLTATAYEASATGFSFGRGAILSRFDNEGTINVTAAAQSSAERAIAILIEDGADIASITNTGAITANINTGAGAAYALKDESGSVASVVNRGRIVSDSDGGVEVALDFSSHGAGAGVSMLQDYSTPTYDANDDDAIDYDDVTTPYIGGDMLFGAGADSVDIRAGSVDGDITFGAGADTLSIDDSTVIGNVDFGAGADAFSVSGGGFFYGAISDSDGALDISVDSSYFALENADPLTITSLSVTGESSLFVEVDYLSIDLSAPRITATSFASIDADAILRATVSNFQNQGLDIVLIESPSLTIEEGVDASVEVLTPAIFSSSVSATPTQLLLTIQPKTTAELGLNSNETAAYTTFLDIAAADGDFGDGLTSYFEEDELLDAYKSVMPVTHDAATAYLSSESSLATGALAQRLDLIGAHGKARTGYWVQENLIYRSQDGTGEIAQYDGLGINIEGGADRFVGDNLVVGLSAGFMTGKFKTSEEYIKQLEATSIRVGPYASYRFGPLTLDAAGSYGLVTLSSTRTVSFGDTVDTLNGSWSGKSLSGSARLGYEAAFGEFYLRPTATLDYFRLKQNGYQEEGATTGDAFAFAIGDATTNRTSASAILNFGRSGGRAERTDDQRVSSYGALGGYSESLVWFQNAYAGYRKELSSSLYSTTAQFLAGGDPFVIDDPTGYEDALLFGFGLGMSNDLFALYFSYDGETAGDAMTHRGGVNFRLRF